MNINRKVIKKTAAAAMACLVGLSTVSCAGTSAVTESSKNTSGSETKNEKKLEKTIRNTSFGESGKDAEKIETVYVKSDAEGSPKNVLVSDWLRNYKGSDKIEDATSLTDIQNVKGNEKYEKGSGDKITWNADGNDIYYQGKTSKELPVGVKVSYKLDGKDISPADLAGKSGHVTIRFDYTNTAKEKINVNGSEENISVPFAMISGMILPSDKFTNINVTNGKVVSDANSNIVMGVALPGLKDALKLDSSKLTDLGVNEDKTIPEYVEITADTSDFDLGLTMTLASSDVLSDLGFDDFNNATAADKIQDDMTKLQDSMKALEDGSGKLKDGTKTLKDGTSKLKSGSGTLKAGTKTLKDGTGELKSGINDYTDGVSTLTAGAKELNDKMADLVAGTKSLSDGTNDLYNAISTADMSSFTSLLKAYSAVEKELKSGDFYSSFNSAQALASDQAALLTKYNSLETDDEKFNFIYNLMTPEEKKQYETKYKEAVEEAFTDKEPAALKQYEDYAIVASALSQLNNKQVSLDDVKNMSEADIKNVLNQAATAEVVKNSGGKIQKNDVTDKMREDALTKMEAAAGDTKVDNIKLKDMVYATVRSEIEKNAKPEAQKRAIKAGEEKMQAAEAKSISEAGGITAADANKAAPTRGYETISDASKISDDDKTWLSVTGMTKTEWKYLAAHAKVTDKKEQNTAAEYIVKYMAFEEKYGKLNAVADKLTENADTSASLDAKFGSFVTKLKGNLKSLNDGAGLLYQNVSGKLAPGVLRLYNGASLLNGNSGRLLDGVNRLDNGASDLYSGAGLLDNGIGSLDNGAADLYNGADLLDAGLVKFDDEGIKKIAEAFDGDINQFTDRLTAINDASKAYDTFAGADENMTSSVKFIFETSEVSSDKN
jgi:putative membrane protein